MKEFSEDEKTIAKNINKEYKWMARDKSGILFAYQDMPIKREIRFWDSDSSICISAMFNLELFEQIKWEDDKPTRIRDIYDPQVLDDTEREYLKTVLKPFHDDVKYVVKHRDANAHFDENTHDQEFLFISVGDGALIFPDFDEGKMYFGMEVDKKYELHELGITYSEEKK